MAGRIDGSVDEQGSVFAALLRRFRIDAGLTQEQLAERSDLSASTISELERGIRLAPQGASARMLADALNLTGVERKGFFDLIEAVRVRPGPRPGQPAALPEEEWPIHGRAAILADLQRKVTGGARWITLVGEGGIGKTRLALELARRFQGEGWLVLWVSGQELHGAPDVVPAVAAAARPSGRLGLPPIKRVVQEVRDRRTLVVLDNMEHLLEAVDDVAALLDAAPTVSVVATSRERFQGRSEVVV
ncbi:MAG: helix-turn-helix domain-containing protein, partial [Thermomicrobiales bacterium]